jgi:hypothetical protein
LPLSSLGKISPYLTGTTSSDGDGLERLLSHCLLMSDDYVDRGQTAVITWMNDKYNVSGNYRKFSRTNSSRAQRVRTLLTQYDHCRGSVFTVLIVTAASRSVVFHVRRVKICPLLRSEPAGFRAETKYIRTGNTRPSGIQPAIVTAATTIALFYAPLSSTDIYYWLLARWPVSSMYTDYRLDPVPPATAYFYIHRI